MAARKIFSAPPPLFPLILILCLPASLCAQQTELTPVQEDERLLRKTGIGVDGPALLKYIKQQTVTRTDEQTIKKLVAQLGDDEFEKRELASAQLAGMGTKAVPLLQQARNDRDPEIVFRADTLLQRIRDGAGSVVIESAIRLVAVRNPPGACEALLQYAPEIKEDDVKETVQVALVKLAAASDKPDAALVKALTSETAIVRRMAGAALANDKTREIRPAVLKLLDDTAVEVRFHVGMALVRAGERDALPALISLLERSDSPEAGLIEALLFPLAGDKAPSLVVGTTSDARKRYREAWEAWYKAEGHKVDLAKLTEQPKLKGHTMVVLLDRGKVIYLDEKNKPLWEIGELQFPLDAQLLSNDNVLVAEHRGGRVTERNQKGEIVWEKKIAEPLVAQRLPNGNTFIATPQQLIEVDRKGTEVFSMAPPDRGRIMKALRLPNGDFACITSLGGAQFQIFDRKGNRSRGFNVDLSTSGGRVELLPNGHVLIPEMSNNMVVEYNRQGKVVWKADVTEPINAVRLPDGNTIITTMNDTRAVEVDRRGKTKWEYRSDTRVTRAWRY